MTAGGWLDPLRAALEEAPTPVTFFFRDDDAGWDDGRLFALLDVMDARALPLDLAVIPRALEAGLAAALARAAEAWGGRLGLHQHGLAHTDHEREGRKCEFGPSRGPAAQRRDLAEGLELLRDRLPGLVQPVFTPPWNRCTAATATALRELGVAVLSRDAAAEPFRVPGLTELPVAVDWSHAKHRGRRLTFAELAGLAAGVARAGGPVGVNLHHAVMDPAELRLLGELADLLAAHPAARCRPLLAVASELPPPPP